MKKILFLVLFSGTFAGFAQQCSVLVLSDIHLSIGKDSIAVRESDADTTLFLSALREAKGKYKYILLPGDLMQHGTTHDKGSLGQTFEYIVDHIREIDRNAIILPALGNNDCLTHNHPDTGTYALFYKYLVERIDKDKTMWNGSFRKGGYYEFRDGDLSIISLNTVRFKDTTANDVAFNNRELNWLEQHLMQDSAKRRRVWIMYHIAPGMDPKTAKKTPTQRWNADLEMRYVQLMRRFANIVAYQQGGHTHKDDNRLILNNGKLVSYLHISPGLIWRDGNNPAFQVLEVNKKKGTVTNITTHYTELGVYQWHTYSFNDFGFQFLLNFDKNNAEGKLYMDHFTTFGRARYEWNETFAKRAVIGER